MFLGTYVNFLKPFIPRRLQILIRRGLVKWKLQSCGDIWPIDKTAAKPPANWQGWPEGKKFALVLTHDVDKEKGVKNCQKVMELEDRLGFRSSFNFVAQDYSVPPEIFKLIKDNGFEIGIHGLRHNVNIFRSEKIFSKQVGQINKYIKEWEVAGFRSPSMFHNLEYNHNLDIEYDASTFDTDPFEPQPDGTGTIFPFWVSGNSNQKGYVELPYTLPQDFLLFILMQEKNIDIWKAKLDWIVAHGGMALFITHPDYLNFNGDKLGNEEYPSQYYEKFLEYIKTKYKNQYWHALPREVAAYWQHRKNDDNFIVKSGKQNRRACLLYYMKFKGSAMLYREAKSLLDKGYEVDIICLRESKQEKIIQSYEGLNLFCIQSRPASEQQAALYFLRLITFCLKSFFVMSYLGLKNRYDVVHVTSPPDIIVFTTIIPKLLGAGIILDIHDIGPELFMRKLNVPENKPIIRLLKWFERLSAKFADHVITVTDIWRDKLSLRINQGKKFSTMMNVPDENLFQLSTARKPQLAEARILFYHGSFEEHFGVDTLIKAMPMVKQQIPQIQLFLYGGGRLYSTMISLAKELGLDDCVHFQGSVPFYELPEILKQAEMGIVPTKAAVFSDEALSMKSLEYMTLGIPIVISGTTAHRYYYNDDMVKFFQPEDENDLAEKIIALCKDNAERNRLVDNANIFLESHGWSCVKEDYYKIVDQVSSKRQKS